ncbi:MAG: hypothetical protein KGZ85_09485 [Ignavibacterium sp.]|nr:hypothetical protein [Ignavibacterium sp.]
MKSTCKKLFLVFFAILATAKLNFAEDVEKTFKVSKQSTLDVSVNYGNVNVFTWDKDELKVLAKNVDSDELRKLIIEQKGSMVKVEFKGSDSRKFSVDIWIPIQFNVTAKTGGGNVKMNDFLSGRVSISTSGGNISTSKINGQVEISTSGGNITCSDIDGDIDASSGGGDIKLTSVTGLIDVSTAGGNITIGKAGKSADVSTAGGNINVSDVGGNADISTAGGNISVGYVNGTADISSGGGNINVLGSKGKVEVSTGGGNVNLKNIGGGVDATTGAGKINVELSTDFRQSSSISTAAGDIILTVPDNIKVSIIARVKAGFIDKSDKGYIYIKSEFDGLKYDVDHSNREVVARLDLNGGAPTIELETNLGKIEIKKK